MKEIWKDIEGYDGTFQVSNLGRVKTFNYQHRGIERVLKPKKHNKGYLQIQLQKGDKNKTFTIHRLVAKAFIPNPNNLELINHKDENKQNNCVDNLEWCDRSYNARYSMLRHPERISHRHYKSGRKVECRLNFKIHQFDMDGNFIREWENSRTIFKETGMSDWAISEVCRGNRHKAYGFIWRYAN